MEKTFTNCSLVLPNNATPPNFVEKNFTNSRNTSKFVKVFSLESFPLYGTDQDVTTVYIMVLKLQSLETKIIVLISEVFLIQEENNMWQSRGELNIIPLVPH